MLRLHLDVADASEQLAELERDLASLAMLQDVLRWGFSCVPPWEVLEVIAQDEYCQDVILWQPQLDDGGRYLCFDTT